MKSKKKPPLAKKYLIRNIVILAVSILLLAAGTGCIVLENVFLAPINTVETSSSSQAPATPSTIDSGTTFRTNGANQVNGLLTDEAVTNVLMIGVDDYQKDDPIGRSDSMMLISIDNRHKKIKVSSFLRDTYLAIPNNGSNKLNSAYHFGAYNVISAGKAKAGDITSCNSGAQLCIQTLELNFGMKIDRYVVVKDSAFDDVVGVLKGVDINVTAKEAAAINTYSGAGCKLDLKDGVQHLDGAQAHYYGRIRADNIPNVNGNVNDEGRAERQRLVVQSVLNKFKTSDIATISSLASGVLPKVITNFSRDEIVNFVMQSGTILHYPMSQNQIPGKNNYTTPKVLIGGQGADIVQITSNKKCVSDALTFIYENDKPDVSKIGLAAVSDDAQAAPVAASVSSVSAKNTNKKIA